MRPHTVGTLALWSLLGLVGCVETSEDEAIELENSLGKADGNIPLTYITLGTTGRAERQVTFKFECDESFLDFCNVTISVHPAKSVTDAVHDIIFAKWRAEGVPPIGTEETIRMGYVSLAPSTNPYLTPMSLGLKATSGYAETAGTTEFKYDSRRKGTHYITIHYEQGHPDLPTERTYSVSAAWQ